VVDIQGNDRSGQEYGTLLSSNSNGTFFSISLESTNRNQNGFVDYERLAGNFSVALVNFVSNVREVEVKIGKKIQTKITKNDG
jgi:hypothetical protein